MLDLTSVIGWIYLASVAAGLILAGVTFFSLFRVSEYLRRTTYGAGAVAAVVVVVQYTDLADQGEGAIQMARALFAG